ncbi:MAG: prepilin-type cleavage/methylation domain-containing protein [Candidatus Aminicenantes bacterium]|nr:prepilin-type cleavage/methylation domain-containing protein [Candidatus Aminicenantes bacterium]
MQPKNITGFTIIELLLIVAIIGTFLLLALPAFSNLINKARITRAVSDIAKISQELTDHLTDYGVLPETFNECDTPIRIDPWGNPYEYLVILGKKKSEIQGKWRKDRFLVPLNYDFDLYSVGRDGDSKAPLTAKMSYDDVIRANNGNYIGLASKY